MSTQPGVGSVWNPRTWHWESRSYTAWAEALLRRKLLAVTAAGDGVPLAVRVRFGVFLMPRGEPRLMYRCSLVPSARASAAGVEPNGAHTQKRPATAAQVAAIERLTADASVNLRKGRKFVSFDVSFVVKWEGALAMRRPLSRRARTYNHPPASSSPARGQGLRHLGPSTA